MRKPQKPPKALDAIVDKVLAYKPKPASAAAKKRTRRARRTLKADAHIEIPEDGDHMQRAAVASAWDEYRSIRRKSQKE